MMMMMIIIIMGSENTFNSDFIRGRGKEKEENVCGIGQERERDSKRENRSDLLLIEAILTKYNIYNEK